MTSDAEHPYDVATSVGFTGQAFGPVYAAVTTEVPDSQFSGGQNTTDGQIGRFIHEFFHAFDAFTVKVFVNKLSTISSEPIFSGSLTPGPDGTCGPTSYACGNERENFADSAAVYALDWLSQRGPEPQKTRADNVLNAYGDAGAIAPDVFAKRVKDWTDIGFYGYSIRRHFLNLYFFGQPGELQGQ